ncbi:acyl-CoA reductase [Ammoniphilus sp. CFH 90114]|uniref:acyl-CoA reductase n=1 Tax=Ammoniphilus sp. CFH 90114 TaxID=2493665 RepID=UPI00100E2305|nr:acyl-CoA reductase [Ammoniphilus sp. CFH 90114]RXT05688.1 acyl-CoA reductase [Ammoniphilus sp. CFH 90114]
MILDCFHVPEEIRDQLEYRSLTFEGKTGKIELRVPDLTAAQLEEITRILKKQYQDYVRHLRVQDVIDVLDQAVQRWLDPSYERRQIAQECLPIITGYDGEMIRLFLTQYLRNFRKEKLQRIVDEDFTNPLVLDEFRPRMAGGLVRAYGPELATHIFSGNVPGLPLWSLASGLLVKSATLGKVSSSEPLFPVLFVKTIEEINPKLARAIAIVWWKGGHQELEETAFGHSELVIAYGSERSTREIARRIPSHVRFIPHGHKVSFGVIARECLEVSLASITARLAARDASWFDQQGCLSPHVFFVEKGGKISPRDFSRLLAQEMAAFEHKMPRAALSTEEQQALIQARSQAEFQSFQDEGTECLASREDSSWTVIYREKADFSLSPLNRFVSVIPIQDLEEGIKKVTALKAYLQTVGIACPPLKFRKWIELLGQCGVNRICALGEMPQPKSGWHHDGRLNLGDLVRWCDIESSAEEQMDRYDPNRD